MVPEQLLRSITSMINRKLASPPFIGRAGPYFPLFDIQGSRITYIGFRSRLIYGDGQWSIATYCCRPPHVQ